jgi:hypothetical protein
LQSEGEATSVPDAGGASTTFVTAAAGFTAGPTGTATLGMEALTFGAAA